MTFGKNNHQFMDHKNIVDTIFELLQLYNKFSQAQKYFKNGYKFSLCSLC